MASTIQTDVTDTQAEWEAGTLSGTRANGNALQLANDPLLYRHDFFTLGGWVETAGGSTTITIVDGPAIGGSVAQLAGAVSAWYADRSVAIPFDPLKLYEVSGKVRQLVKGTESRVYLGIEGIGADGVTLVNSFGADSNSSQHYLATAGHHLEVAEEWRVFRGYFQGHGSNPSNHPDPTNPGNLHADVDYIRPMFLTNYDNGGGTSQVAWMQIREVPPPVNHALNKPVYEGHQQSAIRPVANVTDGSRDTTVYGELDPAAIVDSYLTVDLGAPTAINLLGIFHYNLDNRVYNRTLTEVSSGESLLYHTPTPLADYSSWVVGTTGTQGVFGQNGSAAENHIRLVQDPFGFPAPVWECQADGDAAGPSGGWNLSFPCDETKTYRLSVFVRKQVSLADGSTYLGCGPDTETLGGFPNNNPYFWNGDLPALDTWYLLVGIIHPSGYTGGDTGQAGVYSMGGTRLIAGTEWRMAPGCISQRHRAYLYYADFATTRQQFVYPRIEVQDGTEPVLNDVVGGYLWSPVFDSADSGTYAEQTAGKWTGMETTFVRYIRDRLRGSDVNSGDHWVEIEAYGYEERPAVGTRTGTLSLAPAGRITSTQIDWDDRPALMCSAGSGVNIPFHSSHSVTAGMTIEAEVCWMGPGDQDDRGVILTNKQGWILAVHTDGKLACYTYGPGGAGSSYFYGNTVLLPGVWYHVAFTEDAAGYRRLYIDAIEDGGGQFEAGIAAIPRAGARSGHFTQIGAQYPQGYGRDLRAAVREVRLWDYARTQPQLAANKGVRLLGTETGLRGYWPLDEGAGVVATDLTGNSNGRVIGDPRWLTDQVETNVSLDGGSTWQGWKPATKGAAIADIPADADGREVVVDCRQTLDGTSCEATPQIDSLTIEATGNRALMKRWNGSAWVEHTPKTWQTDQWVVADPRVFTNGRWL